MRVSEHKMLSFSVRKKIIENDKSLVVILLSEIGENEFLQTLQPIHKVGSSNLPLLLKLEKNERNDVHIFFSRTVTYESLPASLQSFTRKL